MASYLSSAITGMEIPRLVIAGETNKVRASEITLAGKRYIRIEEYRNMNGSEDKVKIYEQLLQVTRN